MWIKLIDLIRSVTKNANDYDGKYTKIKFISHGELQLHTIPTMTTAARAVFHENKKYYPQVLLDEYLHEM